MAEEHAKGAGNKVKGEVKKAVGRATGDRDMVAEGHADKAKGSIQNAVGDVKDAMRGDKPPPRRV